MSIRGTLVPAVAFAIALAGGSALAQQGTSTAGQDDSIIEGQQSSPFDAFEKQAIERLIHEYLMANPEVIIEAVRGLETRQREMAAERARQAIVDNQEALLNDPMAPTLGAPDGELTLVEFFDYRCPYCRRVADSVAALESENDDLRIVMKEFPILGPQSVFAARAALAADKQGLYEPFHYALMEDGVQITQASVMQIAEQVGLDVEQLRADMEAPEIDEHLRKNYELAQRLGIGGTPAFVIGDKLHPGAMDLDAMRKLVREAREASG